MGTLQKRISSRQKEFAVVISPRTASEGLRSVQSRLGTFPKFREERNIDVERTLTYVERSGRVERRQKATIEQQEQEATKKKLLEQSGDHICDLDFESGASSSEPTEEQLTDGMDTNSFCDGQGLMYETKEFAHSSTQTKHKVALTAASEGPQKILSIYLKELVAIRHLEEISLILRTKRGFIPGCHQSKC